MPTYTVTTTNIAAHNTHTDAPGYFAQVIFAAVAAGDHFIGGKPNTAPHVYILGVIRDGNASELD